MPPEGSVETGNAHWTIGGEMDGLEKAVLKAKKFVVSNFDDLSSSVGTIFLGIGAAGVAAFGAIGSAAIGIADDVNTATGKVQAQLGLTEEQALQFAETIKQVYGNNFGESLKDVGEAVSTTFAGLSTVLDNAQADLQVNTERAIALRDAFGIDVARSIDSVTALIDNFGLSADQAFDFVTGGLQRGLNKSDDFLETITEYSNQFADGGATAGQFFSLMETGLKSGVLGTDKAADAFKEFRIRITEGSDAASQALTDIGINAAEFQRQIANGQKSAAEAFEEVLAGLRRVDDATVQWNAGVALLGTQFEDLGQSTALGLSLATTSVDELAGSTDKLAEQYNTLGTAVEGIRRKFVLALEPIGQALLEVINQHLPDIEAAFDKLATLGPELAGIFGEALETILDTIVPATVAVVEFAAENRELIAAIVELTIKLAPFLLAAGSLLKVVSLASTIMGGFGVATSAAAGVGAAGGVAGLTAALAPLAAALIPIFGAAGIIAFAVTSVTALVKGLHEWELAERQLADSNQALESSIDRRLAKLREEGVALDEQAIKRLDLADQAVAINAAEKDARAADLRDIIEHFAQRTATEQEFIQTRNLALNENLSNEEAAQVALLEIDTATKTALFHADEQQTQHLLEQLGIRTAAKEQAVQQDLTGAITAADVEKALQEDLAAIAEGRFQHFADLHDRGFARLSAGSLGLRSDMSADAVAIREAQAQAAEEAAQAYRDSFDRSQDAATQYSSLLVALTQEDIAAYNALDEAQAQSVDKLVSNMLATGEDVDEIAKAIRESLKNLSLDHRASPSINDLVSESLGSYRSMMEDALQATRSNLGGLRDEWLNTWAQIGDFVSNVLSFLFDQAQAFIQSLGFALGGVARVISGAGFAGGGVVGMAGGGVGKSLVPVVINEHGAEPLFLPDGTRVIPHGEAIRALERGAAGGSGVNVDLGNATFVVRQDADVLAISRSIGDRVFNRMSQMGAYRGLAQTS